MSAKVIGSDRFAVIDASRGLTFRTAPDLKALITDLITNSGEEIALWSEGAGIAAADSWRKAAAEEEARHTPCEVTCEACGSPFKSQAELERHETECEG